MFKFRTANRITPVPIRLKKNDLVEVRTGKEAGKTGKILKVTPGQEPGGGGKGEHD